MRKLHAAVAALAALAPSLAVPVREPTRDTPASGHRPSAIDDATCAVCHPGPTKGLRQSAHAYLLDDERHEATSCTSCHGDLTAHVAAALDPDKDPVQPPPVEAASCASCHRNPDLKVADAAHAWVPRRAVDLEAPRDWVLPPEDDSVLGMNWSAMVASGFRYVDRHGSHNRYKTDINLDQGYRLTEFELEGRGTGGGPVDLFRVNGSGIADPYQFVEGVIEKDDTYRGRAKYRKDAITYRASGDYHRVDQDNQEGSYDLSWNLTEELEVFGSFTRSSRDGFWLTNRIGNRNVVPLTSVSGVSSPRRLDSDLSEVGISGTLFDTHYTLAAEYLGETQRDRWAYAQPSAINPSFAESENFLSKTSLRGPGGRMALAYSADAFSVDVNGRLLDLDRRVRGNGLQTGFDIGEFTTTSESSSDGDANTWLLDATLSMELTEWASLVAEVNWVNHTEHYDVRQAATTVYPTLATMTTVATTLEQNTSQRLFEGSVHLDLEPMEGLLLTGGYGWSRERLRLPDLELGDPDFSSGTIREDGVLVGASWRPDEHWVVGADYRHFGQNGPQLYQIVNDQDNLAAGKLRYKTEDFWAESFVKYRRSTNDRADYSNKNTSAGVTTSVHRGRGLDLHASYVYSDIDSRTLTNFYFDPDPTPVPTVVGFDGTTHTFSAGLELKPGGIVTWRFDGTYTDTDGSFDITLWDWRTDVSLQVVEGGEAGVMFRMIEYEEDGHADDYGASIALVYWRVRLGGSRQ